MSAKVQPHHTAGLSFFVGGALSALGNERNLIEATFIENKEV
jgi:hypothetical protein